MPNILSQWAARMEYKLYYSKNLQCAESYANPYVLVYDVYLVTSAEWAGKWPIRWPAKRDCTSI